MARLNTCSLIHFLQRLSASLLLVPGIIVARESVYDFEDIELSYVYAAIMGAGSYKIDKRQITMLSFPSRV
jgi:hypothetical protein